MCMCFDTAYYNVQVQQFDVPALAYHCGIAAAAGHTDLVKHIFVKCPILVQCLP